MPTTEIRTAPIAAGIDGALAARVYESALADAGVAPAGPARLAQGGPGRPAHIAFDIEANDLDDAMRALSSARQQLDSRVRFEAIRERIDDQLASRARTVVVNMYGGPGAGKTTAAFEFAEKLKKAGYVVEYAPEYAKELVWALGDRAAGPEKRALAAKMLDGSFASQRQLYNEQLDRVRRCIGQCDFVVTDSPIALSLLYLKPANGSERASFERMVMNDRADFDEFNMVVRREGPYEREGRVHDEAEARAIDAAVTGFLDGHRIPYGAYEHGQIDEAIADAVEAHRRANADRAARRQPAAGPEERRVEENERERGATMAENPNETAEGRGGEPAGFVNVTVPKTGYQGRSTAREIEVGGNPMVRVKMPPHVPDVMTAEGPVDVSNMTFLVPPGAVKEWDNDPGYYQVGFPAANAEGKPWTVNLQLAQGHYENPGAATPEERGRWVREDPVKVTVEAAALQAPLEQLRAERFDYAVGQEAARRVEKAGPAAALAAEAPADAPQFERAVAERMRAIAGQAQPAGPQAPKRMAVPDKAPAIHGERSVGRDAAAARSAAAAQAAAAPERAQKVSR